MKYFNIKQVAQKTTKWEIRALWIIQTTVFTFPGNIMITLYLCIAASYPERELKLSQILHELTHTIKKAQRNPKSGRLKELC